jgi:peptide/nickel transport system permease protein
MYLLVGRFREARTDPKIARLRGKQSVRWTAAAGIVPGGTLVFAFLVVAFFGPLVVPYDPNVVVLADRLQSPSTLHILGTDEFGRDLFARVASGARISAQVVFFATFISAILGISTGMVIGYLGGKTDFILSRALDLMQAFPPILMALAAAAVLGASLQAVVVALGLSSVAQVARIARAAALKTREMQYVEAARAIGASTPSILRRAIFPNSVAPLVIQLSFLAPQAILYEAALSFLGLGVQPPVASWGNMLSAAKDYLATAPYYAIFVGLGIGVTSIGFNVLGDGIQTALDPQLRGT